MLQWLQEHQVLFYWLTGASVVLFVATLIVVPPIIARIPPGYFAHQRRPPSRWDNHHPALRLTLRIGKNALGSLLIVAGIAMLVLPGQGLLTLLVGFLMVEFPGKYRLEKWLISRRRIGAAINWFRRRTGHEPLISMAGAVAGS